MHIEENSKESWTIWQRGEEDLPSEPSLLIEKYADVITIRQGKNYIMMNRESVNDICKHIKSINK